VLALLDERPGLSNADLARRAFVTPQSMNQILRELEDKVWVIRRPHPGHGRIPPAGLTRDGRTVLRACQQAAGTIEEQMLAGLSAADRERLVAALRRRAHVARAGQGAAPGPGWSRPAARRSLSPHPPMVKIRRPRVPARTVIVSKAAGKNSRLLCVGLLSSQQEMYGPG